MLAWKALIFDASLKRKALPLKGGYRVALLSESHQTNSADFSEKAGNALQKALISADVTIIGTATADQYNKYLMEVVIQFQETTLIIFRGFYEMERLLQIQRKLHLLEVWMDKAPIQYKFQIIGYMFIPILHMTIITVGYEQEAIQF